MVTEDGIDKGLISLFAGWWDGWKTCIQMRIRRLLGLLVADTLSDSKQTKPYMVLLYLTFASADAGDCAPCLALHSCMAACDDFLVL